MEQLLRVDVALCGLAAPAVRFSTYQLSFRAFFLSVSILAPKVTVHEFEGKNLNVRRKLLRDLKDF